MTARNDLTAEYLRSRVTYDYDTGILRWKPRTGNSVKDRAYNGRNAGRMVGTYDSDGYLKTRIDNGGNCRVHHLVWLYVHGSWPASRVDHIDRVRDNNRISNLRLVTAKENSCNSKMLPHNKSGFKGVSWNCRDQRWQAFIKIGGRNKNLGSYTEKTEAAEAYRIAAIEVHGEFVGELSW